MEIVGPKNKPVVMTLLHEEEDEHNHEDIRSKKVQRTDKLRNLKMHI